MVNDRVVGEENKNPDKNGKVREAIKEYGM